MEPSAAREQTLAPALRQRAEVLWQIIRLAPVLGMAAYFIIVAIPLTRRGAYWLVSENRPVEMATFLFALAAFVQGWQVIRAHLRAHSAWWIIVFFILFSLGMLLVAGEEIAWGQQFFKFQTPESIAQLNRQGELTLHNVGALQGHNDILRNAFGLGGLVGLWLGRYAKLRPITPHLVLLNWFAIILVISLVDTACDLTGMTQRGWEFGHRLSEVVELDIAVAAFLFVQLKYLQHEGVVQKFV